VSGRSGRARAIVRAVVLLGAALTIAALVASDLPVAQGSGREPESAARTPVAGDVATSTPAAHPSASPAPSAPLLAPLVPVVSFWSPPRNIALVDVARLWAGMPDAVAETHLQSVAISAWAADPLARAFGLPPGDLVRVLSSADVIAAVRASPTTLGLLSAADVGPEVRALSVDGVSLYGPDRTNDLSSWPLVVPSSTPTTFSPDTEWTLAAGGDVNLDRGIYYKSIPGGMGVDFPWSAGYATIDGYVDKGFDHVPISVAHDHGPAGAVRKKLSSSDLTLVNLEGPAVNNFSPSWDSLVFSFDPVLIQGMANAGIDGVTLANNHIKNAGASGVVETCRHLDDAGIAHTGAGANITAARQPAWFEAGGLKVAALGYSQVDPRNWAQANSPGAAPLDVASVAADIRSARAAGADIVIVMPHWGVEYSYSVSNEQKSEAAAFVEAGADLILGSHSHWVGAIQSIDRPVGPAFIDYSLGDLLFRLNHDLRAQLGVIVTLTFSGTRLLQVELAPTVMIDGAQIGLLDPAGKDGAQVLDAIRTASRGLLPW